MDVSAEPGTHEGKALAIAGRENTALNTTNSVFNLNALALNFIVETDRLGCAW